MDRSLLMRQKLGREPSRSDEEVSIQRHDVGIKNVAETL